MITVTAFDVPTSFVGGSYPSGQVTVHKNSCIADHDVLVEFGAYVQAICLDHTANGNCGAPVGKNTVALQGPQAPPLPPDLIAADL